MKLLPRLIVSTVRRSFFVRGLRFYGVEWFGWGLLLVRRVESCAMPESGPRGKSWRMDAEALSRKE